MSFNPNSPRALGLEWQPTAVGQTPLTADAVAAGIKIRSSATETIDQVRLGAFWTNQVNLAYEQRLWMDVYTLGNLGLTDASSTTAYVPNTTQQPVDAFGPLQPWRGVDNLTLFDSAAEIALLHTLVGVAGDGKNVQRVGGEGYTEGTFPMVRFGFDTAAFPGSQRPLAVFVDYSGYVLLGGGLGPGLGLDVTSSLLQLSRNSVGVGDFAREVPMVRYTSGIQTPADVSQTLGPFYFNPQTHLPWTVQDIRDFDLTYEVGFGFEIPAAVGTQTVVYINSVGMRVVSVPERRVAWGPATYPATLGGVPIPNDQIRTEVGAVMQHTDTVGDNWSKLAGTDYLLVVRRLRPPTWPLQNLLVRYLDSPLPNPQGDGQGVDVTIDSSGRLLGVGSENTKSYSVWPVNASAVVSVDAQPYIDVQWIPLHVTAGYTAVQTITPTDNRTYAVVSALVGYTPGVLPDEAIQARIVRVSDNAVMGAAGSVTLTEFAALPDQRTWIDATYPQIRATTVKIVLATAATLVSGTAYRVEFLSATTDGYWLVAAVRADQPDATTGDRSAPGSGTTIAGSADLAAVALDRPAAPGTITTTVATVAATNPGDTLCEVGTVPRVTVDWSSTVLGSAFARHELERFDDGAKGWQLIANVRTESTESFVDFEMLRNVPVYYRIRTVRTDGGISAWATSAAVTPVQADGTVHVASNNAGASLGFMKLGADDDWAFRSSGQVTLRPMFERDMETALRPTETLGMQYSIPVLIWTGRVGAPVTGAGTRAFQPLLALVDNPLLPYLAVLSPEGERVYANVVAPNGRRQSVPRTYVAFLDITEISALATPIEV